MKRNPSKKNPDVFTVLAQCQNQPNEATTETKYEMWQDSSEEKNEKKINSLGKFHDNNNNR